MEITEEKENSVKMLDKIKLTLEEYEEIVPMDKYLLLAKEYKKLCLSFDKLLTKEKDRNRKFIEVKRELLSAHQEDLKVLKNEIENYKREVFKYRTILKDKEHVSQHTKDENNVSNDKPILKDEVNNLIIKHFSEDKIKGIIDEVIQQLSTTTLDFSKITISFFDDNKILLLQRAIYRRIMVVIESDSSSVVSAITNTILRDNYNYIHIEFAKKVLEYSNISRGVFKFFENHFVEDDSGVRWNSFAITRFMGEYLKQTESFYRNEEEYSKYIKRLADINSRQPSLDETNENINESMAERKRVEKLISLYKLRLTDEESKISDVIQKYKSLLDGVTKSLLQKRIVIKK